MHKIALITLGCPKNTVDSERMHRLLEHNGYEVTEAPEEAHLIVVNTCGFIGPAKQESIDTILEAADYKGSGPCRGVVVTGCMAERYLEELREELTEADLIVGLAGERDIVTHCDRLLGRSRDRVAAPAVDRHLLTPDHWAYLRVSDGCDRPCSFCAIPRIRGPYRSEPAEDLVAEAHRLVAGGVREIVLISQDTLRYGVDLYGRPRLAHLVHELARIDGLRWLRLLYAYPAGWRPELIDLLASEEKLCGYVDMPIQHASDPILRSMVRGTTVAGIRTLIRTLQDRVPRLTLRSAVIVGYPGEREEHVRELMEFIEEIRFHRLVGFCYSHEDGTPAGSLADDVPDEEKRERLDRLMWLQAAIASEIHEQFVGETLQVLVDRAFDGPDFDYVGRTRMDAPEIDGEVFIRGPAEIGEFAEVEITEAHEYDLVGRIAGPPRLLGIERPREKAASSGTPP